MWCYADPALMRIRLNIVSPTRMSKVQQSYQWGRMEWLAGSEVANAEILSVARMQMLPGGEGERHRHPNCEEASVVIRGSVEIRIGEKSFRCSAGECVVVSPG